MRNACITRDGLDVNLTYAHDLTLIVADDGVGMDPAIAGSGKRRRFGLPGMRERAVNIGGTLTIDSSSSGTRITLAVPGRSAFQRKRSSIPFQGDRGELRNDRRKAAVRMARQALEPQSRASVRNGVPLLARRSGASKRTLELVNRLRDEL